MRSTVAGLLIASAFVGAAAAAIHGSMSTHARPPAPQSRALRGDANLLLPSDIAAPAGVVSPTWSQYELNTEPTLVCQGRWLTDLGQATLIFRKYQTDLGHGIAAPVAREAVLDFDTTAAAEAGYQTAASWLTSCPATLTSPPLRDAGPRTLPATVPTTAGQFEGVRQHTIISGSSYDDFVGRSGTRLLVFEYSQAGSDGDRPFAATLRKAAMRAAQ